MPIKPCTRRDDNDFTLRGAEASDLKRLGWRAVGKLGVERVFSTVGKAGLHRSF